MARCAGNICQATNLLLYPTSVRLQKDKSMTQIFMTEFQKDKSNLVKF